MGIWRYPLHGMFHLRELSLTLSEPRFYLINQLNPGSDKFPTPNITRYTKQCYGSKTC